MPRKPKLRVVGGTEKPDRRRGRQGKWEPTPLERRTVERCMAIGFTAEQAGQVIGKSVDSLERHCRKELDTGYAKLGAKIGGQLIRKALAGDTAALIFFAKCRLGWNEKQILEHQGRNGGPIQYDAVAADADAFAARMIQLGERYRAQITPPAPVIEAAAIPAPEPEQIN